MGCTVQAGLAPLLTLIWTPPKEVPDSLYSTVGSSIQGANTKLSKDSMWGSRVTPSVDLVSHECCHCWVWS